MTEHNNPPAYPHEDSMSAAMRPGMSLLDHFAGLAMQAFANEYVYDNSDAIADRAYTLANAMLKERAKWIK